MNARQVLAVSALALASAASFAQTVPAEQWVGAPIAATTSMTSRSAVASDYMASRSMASAPAELRVGPADAGVGAASRAEVAADRNLWIRSGLSQVANRDDFDPTSAAYRKQVATYQNLRNGPQYMAEVQRVKSGSTRVTTSAQYGTGSSAN
ncbi:hypothetical protein QTH87_06825 [Variovorax sp. J22P168]|uniref:hypothetical protein n=1 Tax=Variovorax jilinensis TaxID=3053513 RepID=UPI0025789B68|nr:hypothetical protein [Variovorax sp. J22P168]MDM0012153.1 hypothetical protein [Variovorax sp. J22P168]